MLRHRPSVGVERNLGQIDVDHFIARGRRIAARLQRVCLFLRPCNRGLRWIERPAVGPKKEHVAIQ